MVILWRTSAVDWRMDYCLKNSQLNEISDLGSNITTYGELKFLWEHDEFLFCDIESFICSRENCGLLFDNRPHVEVFTIIENIT